MLEIFVLRKENTSLWGHKFNIKEIKVNEPCVFLQSRSDLRPTLPECGKINQDCRVCLVFHEFGLFPSMISGSG